jgi:hypothetical protein
MVALLKLYQLTGDRELLDISHVMCACLFDNVGLWSMRYGHARDRASFFGVFPMPKTPYTAAYEQAEVSAACLDYIVHAGDDLPPSMTVLLPELIRHVTARLDMYYPTDMPADMIADSPKTGHLLTELCIPVEDVGDGWDQVGTIGQEVYGAGIAFSTLARSNVRVPGRAEQVYCEYPFAVRAADSRHVVMHIFGDSRLQARLRVLGEQEQSRQGVEVRGSNSGIIDAAAMESGDSEFWVPGGQDVTISFAGD